MNSTKTFYFLFPQKKINHWRQKPLFEFCGRGLIKIAASSHDLRCQLHHNLFLHKKKRIVIVSQSRMTSYSCISCRVSFAGGELQRVHYKSDWHRYNLKRKVAELPPVTQEVFNEKLAQQQKEQSEEKKDTTQFCSICSKSFSNQNAYMNHLKSKKHKLVENKKVK